MAALDETYPRDAAGRPLDTPDWRNTSNINDTAKETDPPTIKATRAYANDAGMIKTVLADGADVNATDKFGLTALMLAIKGEQEPLIWTLLEHPSVNVDLQSKRGFTALMYACWKGNTKVAQKLMDMGANLQLLDTGSRSAWGVAHDWDREDILEMFNKVGFNFESHETRTVEPPAPKWRPSEDWS